MAYQVVLALHVLSVVVAFGALFATPLVLSHVRGSQPAALAALHRAQRRVGLIVTVPGGTVALLTGAYMATIGGYWEELWVSLPLSLLVFLLSAQGAFLAPTERRLEALAGAAFADGGSPELESEYAAVARRYAVVAYAMCAAVVVAVAVMVTKVGG